MKKSIFLILGNGGAALMAVAAARGAGHTDPIQLVSDRPSPAFNPMLSPYFLAGIIPYERCFPFGNRFYTRHGVDCIFGSPVKRLDLSNQTALLVNGKSLHYDKCLIATGAKPSFPPAPGLAPSDRILALRTAEETTRIRRAMEKAKSAVVLGASLVGLQMTETFLAHGISVTLVDVADQILPTVAHPICASMIQKAIRAKGVTFGLGWGLENAKEGKDHVTIFFQNGETLTTDLCFVAAGVKANKDFIENSSLEMDVGILVDDRMQTSKKGVYSAGDVCQGLNMLSGKREFIGLWGNACYQGRTAGLNMAGKIVRSPGAIPNHISKFFGMEFVHVGDIHCKGASVEMITIRKVEQSLGKCCVLVFDSNVLVGLNLVNCTDLAGRIRLTIAQKINWNGIVDRLKYHPTFGELNRALCNIKRW
jgi:NADPH-dependent 2,4-dienoyl-CoA reductase/sulfur reductase-like enzyme